MDLKFTNIQKDKATILLYRQLGEDGIDGSSVANEIQFINEYYSEEIKCIDVRINSVGGSVQHGLSICGAILNSKIPCDTYIDGMAYSMAGVVAMCGRNKYMVDYGTFMMHNVAGGDNEEVIDLLTNSLAMIFERTTSLTMDKCREMMASETWMDAEQCLSMGLINSIIKTDRTHGEVSNSILEIQKIYNKLINKKQNKMTKVTDLLNLSNEASEDAIVESINAKDAKIKELQNTIAEAQSKIKELNDANEAAETAQKLEIIENAIKEGKIDPSVKEIYVNSGKSVSELKDVVSALKPAYTPVFDNKKDVIIGAEGRESWSFTDWSKKDPQGLATMQKNDPTAFNNLVNALPKNLSPNYNPETDKKF